MTLDRRRRRAGVLTVFSFVLAGVGLLPPSAEASNVPNWSGGQATVKIVKKVFLAGSSPDTAVPAGGWEFRTPTGGVTPASGRTAGGTGAVTFTVKLGSQWGKTVAFAETPQPGFTLYPVHGWNAYCMASGKPVWSANDGPYGFKVEARAGANITCTVLNKASKPPAEVVVDKKWVINGKTFDNGQQPPGFEAALELTGQQNPDFGTVYAGYRKGDRVTIGETLDTAALPPGCWPKSPSGDLGDHWLAAGLNRFTIVNKIYCKAAKLTLVKHVINDNGTATPSDWILHATPASGSTHPKAIEGRSGSAAVTGAMAAPGVAYVLSESDGPANYRQIDLRCVLTGTSTEVPIAADKSVTMGAGQDVTCTFTDKETEALPVTGNLSGPMAGVGVGVFLLGLVLFIAAHKWRRLTDD